MLNLNFKVTSGWRWLWVAALVILLDRFTKIWALQQLTLYVPVRVLSFFNFTLAYNKGAAFSFLNNASGWQVWVLGSLAFVVSVSILIWLKKTSYLQRWMGIALNLILGGAIGNLWDRFQYGHVIDFIDLHISGWSWPAFNIADSAICLGAAMILYTVVMKRR